MGCGEDRLGFIMFECGFEGIKLKIVKRSQFEKGENGDSDKKNEAEVFCTDSVKSQDELDNNIAGKKKTILQVISHQYCVYLVYPTFSIRRNYRRDRTKTDECICWHSNEYERYM